MPTAAVETEEKVESVRKNLVDAVAKLSVYQRAPTKENKKALRSMISVAFIESGELPPEDLLS